MRILVDTQAVIYFVDQDHALGAAARSTIADPTNDLFVSAASVWEVAIKVGLKKLSLSLPYEEWMNDAIAKLDLAVLPVTVGYAAAQAGLPMHHRDPFDRLLVAQALVEGMPIVSADSIFDQYGVSRIW